MFWRILKKDLKRKKTMNIILLMFVILSAMFATASVNNIIAVTGGIEHFFDEAGLTDAMLYAPYDSDIDKKIGALPSVSEVRTEHFISVFSSGNFRYQGKKLENFTNPALLVSDSEMGIRYFDDENKIIENVDKGCFYCTAPFLQDLDISKGDEFELEIGDSKLTLTYMGLFKDAAHSSENAYNPRLIINNTDYDYLAKDPALYIFFSGKYMYVNTDDVGAVSQTIKGLDNVSLSTRDELKAIFLYAMLLAYIMLSVSVILMLVAFVVLRFTIAFTISEEFREIGVMKAVGIDNGSIRRLYIVKYFAIAVIGAAIGFAGSIPLSTVMLKTVSKNIVLSSENSVIMGFICSMAVVALIMIFCHSCTRRVNKLSPIDAVRNGQTGERFGKKSLFHLGRSKLPTTGFLAANDVVSAPKQFIIITVIFTLCMLMMTLMSNFSVTLKSGELTRAMCIPDSDVHMIDVSDMTKVFTEKGAYKEIIEDREKMLAEGGMPGKCTITMGAFYETICGDKSVNICYFVTKGISADELYYDEGSAPQKHDEVALTGYAMKALDAEIGDRINVTIGGEERELIITGRFSAFQQGGYCAVLCEEYDLDPDNISTLMGVQIRFDGDIDKDTINRNIAKIKELTGSDKVYTSSEVVKIVTGLSDPLNSVKHMMMLITVIVTAMIVVLMERSFISKEKSETALMKAVGIPGSSIITQHILRFVIVSLAACVISSAVIMPVSKVLLNFIFAMVGDVTNMNVVCDPIDIFVICPAILLVVTTLGSFITALYTKTIKASDTASIE